MKKLTSILLITILCLCTSFGFVNTYASEETEDYIEFTVPENFAMQDNIAKAANQSFVQKVTTYSEELPGSAFTAQYNKLTVSGRAAGGANTVTIKLKVKGALNQYYTVSGGTKTLTCNNTIYNLFSGFNIQSGKTYRFYYKANGNTTDTADVSLSVIIWE